jgi:UDP-glucose 4-epimerase
MTLDLPMVRALPYTIAEMVPNNYKAVNLGSGDGMETAEIVEACVKAGK